MPPVHSKLAASASAAAKEAQHFENGADSYRVVLSDDGIDDMIVELTATPKKDDKGKILEGQYDIKAVVFSRKAFAKDGKKLPIKYFTPESPVRYSTEHTVGSVFSSESENVNSRKRCIVLQTKFENNDDGTNEGDLINDAIHKLAERLRPYDDINVELHWHAQQLRKVERKINRAILMFEKAIPEIRTSLNSPARMAIALKHQLDPDDVTSEHPDYYDAMLDLFEGRSEKAMPIKVCKRQSEPDQCPKGTNCSGDSCKHPEHVRGQKQYTVALRDYIFVAKEYNPEVRVTALPFTNVVKRWEAENPGSAQDAHKLDANKASVDALTLKMALENPLVMYNPVFYRQKTRFADTINVTKKRAKELAAEGKPFPHYYTAPHKPIVRFGTTARFCVSIKAGVTTGKGGVGMRLNIDSTQIVVVRQQKLSFAGVEADELASYQEDLNLDDTWEPPVVGSSSAGGSDLMSVIASADVHTTIPGQGDPSERVAGEKRKAEHQDGPKPKVPCVDTDVLMQNEPTFVTISPGGYSS